MHKNLTKLEIALPVFLLSILKCPLWLCLGSFSKGIHLLRRRLKVEKKACWENSDLGLGQIKTWASLGCLAKVSEKKRKLVSFRGPFETHCSQWQLFHKVASNFFIFFALKVPWWWLKKTSLVHLTKSNYLRFSVFSPSNLPTFG